MASTVWSATGPAPESGTSSWRIYGRGPSLPATVRAYAFDLANLARFLDERDLALGAVEPLAVFVWVDWQGTRAPASGKVVRLASRSAAPATINRRVAAVRAFFECW